VYIFLYKLFITSIEAYTDNFILTSFRYSFLLDKWQNVMILYYSAIILYYIIATYVLMVNQNGKFIINYV